MAPKDLDRTEFEEDDSNSRAWGNKIYTLAEKAGGDGPVISPTGTIAEMSGEILPETDAAVAEGSEITALDGTLESGESPTDGAERELKNLEKSADASARQGGGDGPAPIFNGTVQAAAAAVGAGPASSWAASAGDELASLDLKSGGEGHGHGHGASPDNIVGYLGPDGDAPAGGTTTAYRSDGAAYEVPTEPQENGSGDPTTSVAASGDQSINGLLSGVRWSDGSITYSDPNSTADYQSGYPSAPLTGFGQVSAQQMVAVHFGLNASIYTQPASSGGFSVEGFTNLSITYAGSGSGSGTIRVANSSDPGTAYAYYPSTAVTGGDAFFGPSGDFPDAGDYDWHTVLHELGHSLGLAHGHTGGGFGALPASEDSQEWSIMTYRTYIGGPTSGYTYESWGAPQTFMRNDIMALQYMYGADYTTNSGNTTYKWNPGSGDTIINGSVAIDAGGNVIFATIWDGGGIDIYDLTSYTSGVNVNLNAGAGSIFDDTQRSVLGSGQTASHSIYNAFLYGGSTASLIERAYGGSGNDTLIGNQADNLLDGNAGNDYAAGGDGRDSLYGDAGIDSLYGQGGTDYILGGDDRDFLYGQEGRDTIYGQDGDDYLYGGLWSDYVYGGNGNDYISVLSGEFYDWVDGGAGEDTLNHYNSTYSGTTFNFLAHTITGTGVNTDIAIALNNIEVYYDGSGSNTIISDGSGRYYGYGGDDTMHAGNGTAETLDGGAGVDLLDTTHYNFNYVINLATGLTNFTGEYFINFENVVAGGGNDLITGNSSLNSMDGGGGNDTLIGSGNDSYYGGLGDDVFRLDSTPGAVISGGGGIDTLDFSGNTLSGTTPRTFDIDDGYSFNGGAFQGTWSGLENLLGWANLEATIIGNSADNFLQASSQNDTILGESGDDSLIGLAGNDLLEGSSGFDSLVGGDGNDTLRGGFTTDTVEGGAGNDLIEVFSGEFYDVTDGGAGNDTLDHGDSTYSGTVFDFLGGEITGTGINGLSAALAEIEHYVDGSGDNEIIWYSIFGGTVDAGAGDDTVHSGLNSGETLDGGAGIDLLDTSSFSGAYSVNLSTGLTNYTGESFVNFEHLVSGSGHDTLTGTSGGNSIDGGDGHDMIAGGGGVDTLIGGDGNDTLDGQGGSDDNYGGAGDDLMYMRSGDATDNYYGGTGSDTVDFTNTNITTYVNLATGVWNFGGSDLDMVDVENIITADANDTIIGNASANFLNANGGDDSLSGGDGNDTIFGGAGADTVTGGSGADYMHGGGGAPRDRLDYGASSAGVTVNLAAGTGSGGDAEGDTIVAFEDVFGSTNDDNLSGNSLANWLVGGAGNDTLAGGASNDILNGSGGSDFINGGDGADFLIGAGGNDTASYASDTTGVDVRLFNGFAAGGQATGDVLNSIENLLGGSGNDVLWGDSGGNWLAGNTGNDSIFGLDGNDVINGGAGGDLMNGGAGIDTLSYGSDSSGVHVRLYNNFASGGEATGDSITGFENLVGGSGNDLLYGDSGANLVNGGGGNDTVVGGAGADNLYGGSGRNLLSYSNDSTGVHVRLFNGFADGGDATGDTFSSFQDLEGGFGNDTLWGSASDDLVVGNAGNDYLHGSNGNDSLFGTSGMDTLLGAAGDDFLHGGADADRFVFGNNFGNDTVAGFSADNAEDVDLSSVGAITDFTDLITNHLVNSGGTAMIVEGANSILLAGVAFASVGTGLAYSEYDFIF